MILLNSKFHAWIAHSTLPEYRWSLHVLSWKLYHCWPSKELNHIIFYYSTFKCKSVTGVYHRLRTHALEHTRIRTDFQLRCYYESDHAPNRQNKRLTTATTKMIQLVECKKKPKSILFHNIYGMKFIINLYICNNQKIPAILQYMFSIVLHEAIHNN